MPLPPKPTWTVHHGDSREVLAGFPDASFDALVTDPPAGIEFMGKEWDTFRERDANPSGKQTESWDESGGANGEHVAKHERKQGEQLR